jgi:hypothetical protein
MNKNLFSKNITFLLIIIILAIAFEMINNDYNRESFVPVINEIYKPCLRKMRNYTNDTIETFSTNGRVFLKKFRLL